MWRDEYDKWFNGYDWHQHMWCGSISPRTEKKIIVDKLFELLDEMEDMIMRYKETKELFYAQRIAYNRSCRKLRSKEIL